MPREERTVYEMIGAEAIEQLVYRFYEKVEADESLRSVFPEDLEPGKRWQYLFLVQYFGGPTWYSDERGHPRLRMRHMPFPIDQAAQEAWLTHMLDAIDEVGIEEPARGVMRDYFQRAASFMVNRHMPPKDDA
jgi:hemoglobin